MHFINLETPLCIHICLYCGRRLYSVSWVLSSTSCRRLYSVSRALFPPSPSSDWLYLLGLNDWFESSVSGLYTYIDLYLPRNQLSLVSTTDLYSTNVIVIFLVPEYIVILIVISLVILSSVRRAVHETPLTRVPYYLFI